MKKICMLIIIFSLIMTYFVSAETKLNNETIIFSDIDKKYSVLKDANGDDFIIGGAGFDKIVGERGDDIIYGGNDDDDLGDFYGNNVLIGGNGSDVLRTGGNKTVLIGGNGDDRIESGGDQCTVVAGNGNDKIEAGKGYSIIFGGNGNDELKSVLGGNSLLIGGDGDDKYILYIYQYSNQDIIIEDSQGYDILEIHHLNLKYEEVYDGNDLKINFDNNTSITIKNYKKNINIEKITKIK